MQKQFRVACDKPRARAPNGLEDEGNDEKFLPKARFLQRPSSRHQNQTQQIHPSAQTNCKVLIQRRWRYDPFHQASAGSSDEMKIPRPKACLKFRPRCEQKQAHPSNSHSVRPTQWLCHALAKEFESLRKTTAPPQCHHPKNKSTWNTKTE